jgi:hypothetical protein
LSSEYGKVARIKKGKTSRTVQIISKGRTGPVPVQGGINQTVVVSRPPQAARTQDWVAPPPSDIRATTPKRGCIALVEVDEIGCRAVKPTQLSSILDIQCFDSLNGFPKDKDFVPFGVFANAQDLDNPNRDGAGAVQTAGTVTIINRSGETICPGMLVFVDTPDIISQEGSDAQMPLIKELGMHPQKYCPSTRPLHWNSERNATKAIEVEMETILEAKFASGKDYSDIMAVAENKLKITMDYGNNTPLYHYGMCYMSSIILTKLLQILHSGTNQAKALALLQEIAKLSIDHFHKLGELADKHNGYTYGVTGKFKRYPSNRVTDFLKDYKTELGDANFSHIDLTNARTKIDMGMGLIAILIKKFSILVIDWNTEIINYFRSKVIGRALDYSLPGTQVTIQMGYYFA